MDSIKKETYNLFHSFTQQVTAKQCLELMLNSDAIKYQSKNFVKQQINRLTANINALRLILPHEKMKILDEQMLDTEVSAQISNIDSMLADLPKAKRDEIEKFIEVQHRVYNQRGKF